MPFAIEAGKHSHDGKGGGLEEVLETSLQEWCHAVVSSILKYTFLPFSE